MRVQRRFQNGFSSSAAVSHRGSAGLTALGSSAHTDDVAGFDVRGTQWGFGRATITDLTLTSFTHQSDISAPLGFPVPGSVSVLFVLAGSIEVRVAGSTFFFTAMTAAVLLSNELPHIICRDPTRVLVVTLDAHGAELDAVLPECFTSIAAAVVRTHPALTYFLALIQSAGSHAIETTLTAAIIASLISGLLAEDRLWHTRVDRPQLSRILKLISEHHTEPEFDKLSLARASFLSPRALKALLLDQGEGKSSAELITERRIVAAMTLLRPESLLTVQAIAERCGFATVRGMEVAVEHVYGVSATALLDSQQPA